MSFTIGQFLLADTSLFRLGSYGVRADDVWIVATAIACCVACGLVGCCLVLRRMALLGDAISHAILPGLALAFILTGTRSPVAMFAGALAVGVLTAVLSAGLNRFGKVSEDSALGVVFTTLFALGVLMITFAARDVDLDPGCVLYGLIEFTPFDTLSIGGLELPRAFVTLGAILALTLGLIVLFYKELKLVCFDPALATTLGISAAVVHYGLMTLVAATTVASFEAVGSILVIAMLVAPGATAHLLTDRLRTMLLLSALVAALSAVMGYALAVMLNTSVAGMIASVALGLFIVAVIFSPSQGLVAKALRQLRLGLRITREDVLGLLYRAHESEASAPLAHEHLLHRAHAPRSGRWVLALLKRQGLVADDPARGLVLTSRGLDEARAVVRGHRLWETYLATAVGKDPGRVHKPAHATEHFLSPTLQEKLSHELRAPSDPHGKQIP